MPRKKYSVIFIMLSISLIIFNMLLFIEANDSKKETEFVFDIINIFDYAEWLNISLAEIEEIHSATVVDIDNRNPKPILDSLGIVFYDKTDTKHIDKIYTINYADGLSRMHIIDYTLMSSKFKRTYTTSIFKQRIRDGEEPKQEEAFDVFREHKTTIIQCYKYVQVLNENNIYETVVIAKNKKIYDIQFVEGLDGKQPYSYITTNIILNESTPHYDDNTWLRTYAIQYVRDFGFGEILLDSY